MKIVIFGASGGTGCKLIEQALEQGHEVTAFVRSSSKLQIKHPHLTLVEGDAMDPAAVERAIAGQDALISALGPTRLPVDHTMETIAMNIVIAMQRQGVRRLISMTGAGVRQPQDAPKPIDHLITALLKVVATDVWLDSAANVKVIQSPDLDWTVVRYPRLIDGKHTGKYRVAYVNKESGTQISRADAADFVLKELTERKWSRKLPLLSY